MKGKTMRVDINEYYTCKKEYFKILKKGNWMARNKIRTLEILDWREM
jgi:hypothetical protein